MPEDLKSVLMHVRRSYRLLNAYHERILYTIPQIGKRFAKEFLSWEGYHQFRGQRWNRDVFNNNLGLMPLQISHFLFRSAEALPNPGEWLLDITHVGDSSTWEIEDYDPTSLPDTEQTHTEIRLHAFLVIEGHGGNYAGRWWELWHESKYPGDEPEEDKEIAGEIVWQGTSTGCKVWSFGKIWSVADFSNPRQMEICCQKFQEIVGRVTGEARLR